MNRLRRLLFIAAFVALFASASRAQAQSAAPPDDSALESALATLKAGDLDAAIHGLASFIEGVAADEKRTPSLARAYEALVVAYSETTQYRLAAETLAKVAANRHFDEPWRSSAAVRGIELFLALGDRTKAEGLYRASSKPPEATYAMASVHYDAWEAAGGNASADPAERALAVQMLEQFHAANKGKAEPAPLVVEAAFRIGKMKRAAGDKTWVEWFKRTVEDWKFLEAHPGEISLRAGPQRYLDYAAEADYALVDDEISRKWDFAIGHHRYTGTVVDVKKAVDQDLAELKKWQDELRWVSATYRGVSQIPVLARIGTLYEGIRVALELSTPSYVSPQTQAKLDKFQRLANLLETGRLRDADCLAELHKSCADAAQVLKQTLQPSALASAWRVAKQTYLHDITQEMVNDYASAVVLAHALLIKLPVVEAAERRLEWYTSDFGPDWMRGYIEQAPDPINAGRKLVFHDGDFEVGRSASKALPDPPATGLPLPSPVGL
jgi:hypothetical protein